MKYFTLLSGALVALALSLATPALAYTGPRHTPRREFEKVQDTNEYEEQ